MTEKFLRSCPHCGKDLSIRLGWAAPQDRWNPLRPEEIPAGAIPILQVEKGDKENGE